MWNVLRPKLTLEKNTIEPVVLESVVKACISGAAA